LLQSGRCLAVALWDAIAGRCRRLSQRRVRGNARQSPADATALLPAPMPLLNRPARHGLGSWLAFAFSLLSVLVTAVLVVVSESISAEQVRTSIGSNLAELAHQTTSRLDRSMFERFREVRLLAGRLNGNSPRADVRAELEAMQQTYPNYAWIGLVDPKGKVVASTGGLLAEADLSARPWFRNARAGVNVGDVHDALPARLLPLRRGDALRLLDLAFPVAWPGSDAPGVLGVHLSWQWARDVETAIFMPVRRNRTVEPLIVSREGVVLLGPADTEGRPLQVPSLAAAAAGGAGYGTEPWPDGKQYLVGYAADRGYMGYPGMGWRVLVRQELDVAYEPIRDLQRRLLLWGLAVAAAFSLLGWALARRITRPLIQLAAGARALDAGKLRELPLRQPYAEVAHLGEALNALLRNLQHKEADLRELNASLERRVEERTAALRETFEHVRENEQRIKTILAFAPDPFIGADFQGRITDWNPRAEALFGWRHEEVLGRPLVQVLVPERYRPAAEQALARFLASGQAPFAGRPMERTVVDRSGREIDVEMRIGIIDTGKLQLMCAFLHDVSHRREVERLKNEFVSTVSHELRTPLTAVYGSLRLLGAGVAGSLGEQGRQLLEISTRSCERLIRLINDVLDVEKIASGRLELKLERHDLGELLERAVRDTEPYAAGFGVTLQLGQRPAAPVVADGDRITQVVVNLLSNAAKFSPRGDRVQVRLSVAGSRARVAVVDHGPGIPEAFRPRVFERFAQADASDRRQKGGTGLGLNICRSIVQAHGGAIGFDSEPGVRTEFFFELPLAG
jgi:PAS domain S-box-containing protein